MENNNCRHLSVRLNYSNPEHLRIMRILDDLNLSVHKSKNQFIVKAVLYYMDALESGSLTNAAERKRQEEVRQYVTEKKLQDELSKIKSTVRTELYEDVLRMFGGAVLATRLGQPDLLTGQPSFRTENNESGEEHQEADMSDTLSQYDNVMQHVMDWSSDD